MLELLTYPPVLRGFLVLLFSGFTFPITGIYLLRMNLLPLRFMLMHGALLGGAIALALQINPFWTTMLVNLLLVWFMIRTARGLKADTGYISIFMMVAAIGLAFVLISVFNVQAKDTMALLWGSLFTVDWIQALGFAGVALFIVCFHLFKYRQLKAVFFDPVIAHSSGVNENGMYTLVILITAFTVAVAMKIIGALLIDAVIILPAIIASLHARSFRKLVLWSSLWGGFFALSGFFVSYGLRIPASAAIALMATVVFTGFYLKKKAKK
ncbi:MAG TPA: iron chelate uptake ABC transporter family permease subunit [Prolixibacteraceae bacterium]|nr:iron chelate uptake ABC transporter family permease subunit [Prolixibacteraceae bacterium]